jgi:hypothetical protein
MEGRHICLGSYTTAHVCIAEVRGWVWLWIWLLVGDVRMRVMALYMLLRGWKLQDIVSWSHQCGGEVQHPSGGSTVAHLGSVWVMAKGHTGVKRTTLDDAAFSYEWL